MESQARSAGSAKMLGVPRLIGHRGLMGQRVLPIVFLVGVAPGITRPPDDYRNVRQHMTHMTYDTSPTNRDRASLIACGGRLRYK